MSKTATTPYRRKKTKTKGRASSAKQLHAPIRYNVQEKFQKSSSKSSNIKLQQSESSSEEVHPTLASLRPIFFRICQEDVDSTLTL